MCPKHGIMEVRRPPSKCNSQGTLRCRKCHSERNAAYANRHPERLRDRRHADYRNNPLSYLLSREKIRAKEKGVPFSLSEEDVSIPEFCPALGLKLVVADEKKKDDSISLDRIIPSLGYVKGNVVIISDLANRIKNSATVEQVEAVAKWLRGLQ